MRIFIRVFWITAFLLTTFSWMVLFQYGFSLDKFSQGVRHELTTLGILAKTAKP